MSRPILGHNVPEPSGRRPSPPPKPPDPDLSRMFAPRSEASDLRIDFAWGPSGLSMLVDRGNGSITTDSLALLISDATLRRKQPIPSIAVSVPTIQSVPPAPEIQSEVEEHEEDI